MNEYEIMQIIELSTAQRIVLIGQIVGINFAMMVAIYYFLNQAGTTLKIAAFILYSLGVFSILMLAVRESNVTLAAIDAMAALDADSLSPIGQQTLAFRDQPISAGLTIALNASIWALWAGVLYLPFIWTRRDTR